MAPIIKKTILKYWNNIKKNWFLPISAIAFFYMEVQTMFYYYTVDNYCYGVVIATVGSVVIAAKLDCIHTTLKESGMTVKLVSFATSVGVCLYGMENFIKRETEFFTARKIEYINIICAVLAIYFVYVCVTFFWKKFNNLMKKTAVFQGLGKGELGVYGLLLITTTIFVSMLFAKTEVFYTIKHPFDIIYTSDSSDFMCWNPYIMLTHHQNDLRQPLFAVFSAPFMGIPYLIARVVFKTDIAMALMMTYAQILLLFLAHIMLARIFSTSARTRICFMIAICSSYFNILFVLMLEQYIVAYFWLILFMYLYCEKKQASSFVLCAAGGSLLTSMVLMPLVSNNTPWKNFWGWCKDMIVFGIRFVVMMLCFCRFGILYSLKGYIKELSRWTGVGLTTSQKISQYTEFVTSCLFAPDATINTTMNKWPSWQLLPPEGINFAAVIILILAVAGFLFQKEKTSSMMAMGWVLFSVVILLGLGWGTKENGLILYALYFGWAFLFLVFQLVEYLEMRYKLRFLVPVVTSAYAISALVINSRKILEMVNFGITYYP